MVSGRSVFGGVHDWLTANPVPLQDRRDPPFWDRRWPASPEADDNYPGWSPPRKRPDDGWRTGAHRATNPLHQPVAMAPFGGPVGAEEFGVGAMAQAPGEAAKMKRDTMHG
jgi:hypothetical protein